MTRTQAACKVSHSWHQQTQVQHSYRLLKHLLFTNISQHRAATISHIFLYVLCSICFLDQWFTHVKNSAPLLSYISIEIHSFYPPKILITFEKRFVESKLSGKVFIFIYEKRNMSKLPKCMLTEGVSPTCSATGYNSYAERWVSTPGSRLCLPSLVIHVPTFCTCSHGACRMWLST